MDENETDDNTSCSRYRSPTFRKDEVKLLLKLVNKYKNIVLNKSTTNSNNYTKDKTWARITKEFNSQSKEIQRSKDVLRTKWDNLKRMSRNSLSGHGEKFSNDVVKCIEYIRQSENNSLNTLDYVSDCDFLGNTDHDYDKDLFDEKDYSKELSLDNDIPNKNFDDSDDEKSNEHIKVPQPFSPRECRILLSCVKKEKGILFSKTSGMVHKRRQAWNRIRQTYNKHSPTKRTVKELCNKFSSMKATAKKVNLKRMFSLKSNQYENLNNMNETASNGYNVQVKQESSESELEMDDNINDESFLELNHANDISITIPDPLSSNVNSSDSGLGSIHSSDKQVTKLKIELLNYKLETAKMERKRIQQALEAEKSEQEMRSLEASMKLRAARLEVLAAEAKFPPSHPALAYTCNESRIPQYLDKFAQSIG